MQMKKRALALLTAVVFALMLIPGVSFAAEMSEAMKAAYGALDIPNADDIRGNISLPEVGENGAAISWTSSDEAVVSTTEEENEGYLPTPAGVITRGSEDKNVTLTATITIGRETAEKVFNLTVKAAPGSGVSLMDAESDKYLMYYFKGDSNGQEQIWLAASEDGLNWSTLNDDQPILASSLGTGGLRDPYVIRSPEGDRYFLIATDLKVSAMGWGENAINGSKSVMIWETTDLTDWGEQRMVEVSTLEGMGCTWAPEASYDYTTGEYVMYWASKVGNYYSIYSARTRDFINFTEPELFVSRDPNLENEIDNVIDTTIIKTDDGYYRFTKNENSDAKRVFMEFSEELTGTYENITTNAYDQTGVEGPEIYQLPDGRYCLILDRYSSGGYFPFVTDSLVPDEDGSVTFTALDSGTYSFPSSPRHGTVVRVSAEEYEKVVKFYNGVADTVTPDEDGSDPIIVYNFDDGTAADSSGNGYDAALVGSAAVVTDDENGRVLSLDGSAGTYLEFPRGVLDGRDELTVSMDVRNITTGNFFTFALGKSDTRYLFARLRPDSIRTAITVNSYGAENGAETSGLDSGDFWTNLTFTVSAADGAVKVYLDGMLAAETETDITISNLGIDTLAYIGKSFFAADAYANMKVDNVEIYNRALSANEIAEKYFFSRYSMTINADEKGAEITDGMFGLFFEDINYAGDGGLYSEIINNRSFEAYDAYTERNGYTLYEIPLYGWSAVGSAALESAGDNPLNGNNPTYLRLTASAAGDGVANDCYKSDGGAAYSGFSARTGAKYNASLYARGSYAGKITVQAVNSSGAVIGESSFDGEIGEDFTRLETELEITGESDKNSTIRIVLSEAGTVELDMISVIPQQTFNGRDNGLRADLVEMLAELNPGFLRFPGGCIVEGYTLANRYQWKHTVGPVEQRTQNWNRWQTHTGGDGRYGYCQTYGLGFYEYLLLCEDIGAAAVPVLSVGIACQYQSGEYSSYDDLYSIYIQDALDLVEFANGEPDADWESIDYSAVDTTNPETFNNNWANLRALMGHPESFGLEYIGIGNEQWDTSDYNSVDENGWSTSGNNFFRRYELFEEEIHKLYPDMKLIGTSGPSSSGRDFENAWSWLASHNGEEGFTYAVDEHYYMDPEWFYSNINRYDSYDRDGFGVFAGEYASRWLGTSGNQLETALSEAAFMTGLEKNSDIVKMASYAPLFAKLGYVQWAPDMIWFDTDTVYGSPDYYVQKLYSNHSGDYNLSESIDDVYRVTDYSGVAGVGTWLTSATFSDFTVTDNVTGEDLTPSGWILSGEEEVEKYEYTVEASAEPEKDAGNSKENVQDGSLDTRWTSNGTDNWLLCDLGEVKTVGKVGVAAFVSSGRSYYYEIQISADGENYTSLFDGTNGEGVGNIVYTFAGNEEARYVKILTKGNSYHEWNGITEVEIYGECSQVENDDSFEATGTWGVDENGAASQSDTSYQGAYLFANESIESNDYTITVKATKTAGAEGFLIPVMASDKNNLIHWNVGGWSNTQSCFEVRSGGFNSGVVGSGSATVLETGREYELKVVVTGGTVYGYIDGELISSYTFDITTGPIYGNSTFDEETGDIIVKLINSSSIDRALPITINYSGSLTGYATEYLLTGDALTDANSIDNPENVAVVTSEIGGIGSEFIYELPAYSFVVLRVHTGGVKAISEVGEVCVLTKAGNLPVLPSEVDVVLSDGTTEQRAVTWRLPTAGTFVNAGTFKVYGDIEGSEIDAVATVIAVSSSDISPEDIISVDEASLRNGESTYLYFNPGVEGEYIGILAVYADGTLVDAQTFKFTESSYWDIVKLLDTENKQIKIMLWSKDGLVPLTEAVVVE